MYLIDCNLSDDTFTYLDMLDDIVFVMKTLALQAYSLTFLSLFKFSSHTEYIM